MYEGWQVCRNEKEKYLKIICTKAYSIKSHPFRDGFFVYNTSLIKTI